MKLFLCALTIASSLSATAGVVGCYQRNYSPSHMANNPRQILSSIKVRLDRADGMFSAGVSGITRSPIRGISRFNSGGGCFDRTVTSTRGVMHTCGIDADGGSYTLEISRDGNSAMLRVVGHVRLEGPSSEDEHFSDHVLNLTQGSTNGVYRLSKVANSNCAN